MIGVLQYLAVVLIIIWAFWRILSKAGRSPWWSYLMLLPIIGMFAPLEVGMAVLLGMPIAMIWIFAFLRWPSIDAPIDENTKSGYDPPEPSRFKGPFKRQTRPTDSSTRRGITRHIRKDR